MVTVVTQAVVTQAVVTQAVVIQEVVFQEVATQHPTIPRAVMDVCSTNRLLWKKNTSDLKIIDINILFISVGQVVKIIQVQQPASGGHGGM